MTKLPLRWAYPDAYALLAAHAGQAGVHAYEFLALSEAAPGNGQIVTLQKDGQTWQRRFTTEELAGAGPALAAFFSDTVAEMAEAGQRAYQDFMQPRRV